MQDSAGEWRAVGRVDEYGPLATDYHLVPLGRLGGRTAKIRLTMTRGNWRVDYVGLAALSRSVDAVRLHPRRVLKDGIDDERALALLCDSARSLTTLPGDTYTLRYHVPDVSGDYELFLESRGYYLEWIREEWIEEENSTLLAQMFLDPQTALKRMAPEYKRVENEMENCFWRSRFAKQK
jgi:hypothetical protein